jgi:hypothetical protein
MGNGHTGLCGSVRGTHIAEGQSSCCSEHAKQHRLWLTWGKARHWSTECEAVNKKRFFSKDRESDEESKE